MMTTYTVVNNTDLRDRPFVTRNRRKAERVWREIRPREDAGNLYSASFVRDCQACGGVQDMTVDHVTCDCPR